MDKLVEEIKTKYVDGGIITHEFLRHHFGIVELNKDKYKTTEAFIEAVKRQDLQYFKLMDILKSRLLTEHKINLRNVRGDGYIVVNPEEQTTLAYNDFVGELKASHRKTKQIMTNVRPVSLEQQSKDNDIRARFNHISQMVKKTRRVLMFKSEKQKSE